jgi:hypothetical protein
MLGASSPVSITKDARIGKFVLRPRVNSRTLALPPAISATLLAEEELELLKRGGLFEQLMGSFLNPPGFAQNLSAV